MGKKPVFSFREDQREKVKEFKSKGYALICNQHNGIALGIVDGDNIKRKVVITKHGKVQRYKGTVASKYDRKSLPRTNKRFINIVQ